MTIRNYNVATELLLLLLCIISRWKWKNTDEQLIWDDNNSCYKILFLCQGRVEEFSWL